MNVVGFELVVIVATVLISVLVARLVLRRADADRVDEWAVFNGVVLTGKTRAVVERYLDNRCWLRRLGAVSGVLLAPAITAGFGIDLGVSGIAWLLLGYLVGVIVAEVSLARVPSTGGRAASLVTRRVRDYAPAPLLVAEAVVPVAALAGSLALWRAGPSTSVWLASQRPAALVAGPVAVVIAIGAAAGQRHLVRRPQPIGDPDLVAVDDALRASAVRLVGGTSATIAACLLAGQCWFVASAPDLDARRWMVLPAIATQVLALLCWFARLPRGYRIRRPGPHQVAPTTGAVS